MSSQLPRFKYALETKEPRTGPGGITRGASVKEFPASVGIAGVSMRLQAGTMREPHWHANAVEWAYVIEGTLRITEQFEAGDIGYAPMGSGHYIKSTGKEVCKILIGFNSGYYQAIDLSAWLASIPNDLLAGNFGIDGALIDEFPIQKTFLLPKS